MSKINQFNANLELQHIYLEVYAERYHYLGSLFESYYCYQHSLTTKQGKPDWEGIFKVGLRSQAAIGIKDRKQLVRDLLVPLPVITGYLKVLVRDDKVTLTNIKTILETYLNYVVMTRTEYESLKNIGLDKKMPASYYQPDHLEYKSLTSRFVAADITLSL